MTRPEAIEFLKWLRKQTDICYACHDCITTDKCELQAVINLLEWEQDLVSLNIENIIAISDYDNNGEGYIVKTSDRGDWIVRESYEDLKQIIKDIGCLIRKQDPRLDTEHPLTMHDLQGMLGEPVWNSNTGKWTLVRNYIEALEPDGVDVAFLLDAAENSIPVTAGDLQKKPLYRMKR